jgi:hypothetical protein
MTETDPRKRRHLRKGHRMFKPTQYRSKAVQYGKLAKTSTGSDQRRDFQELEQRFTVLANNEQRLADNFQSDESSPEQDRSNGITLAAEEEHVLRCLGAALIMQWNSLPTKLRRELFDSASSLGELLETAALRGQIARFLHRHKNNEDATAPIRTDTTHDDASPNAASITQHDAAAIARWDDEGGGWPNARTEEDAKKYRRAVRG